MSCILRLLDLITLCCRNVLRTFSKKLAFAVINVEAKLEKAYSSTEVQRVWVSQQSQRCIRAVLTCDVWHQTVDYDIAVFAELLCWRDPLFLMKRDRSLEQRKAHATNQI